MIVNIFYLRIFVIFPVPSWLNSEMDRTFTSTEFLFHHEQSIYTNQEPTQAHTIIDDVEKASLNKQRIRNVCSVLGGAQVLSIGVLTVIRDAYTLELALSGPVIDSHFYH